MSDAPLQKDTELEQDNDLDHDESTGDDLRFKLAEDLGLDPDDDAQAAILDKAYQRETRQREITAKAIRQKQKVREQLKQFQSKGNAQTDVDFEKIAEAKALEILERRDLQALSLPEELQEEVKTLAQLKKISVLEAARLPYILSRKQEIERETRLIEASPSGNSKGRISNPDPNKPPLRNNYTPDVEGSKAYRQDMDAYNKRMKDKSN